MRPFENIVFRESLTGPETNLIDGTSRDRISATIGETSLRIARFRRGENSVTIGSRLIGIAF